MVLQSDPRYRQKPDDLTRLYTRTSKGKMVPLSAVVDTQWVTGPDLLPHFNGFPASKVNGNAASGFSSGQAIAAMEEVAKEVLPPGYTFAWSGLAFEEKKAGGTSAIAFVFGLIFVFLILAAQYESWTLPGAVMTAVPFGIFGALVFNWLRGLENDVYFQIGLLVLIGLGAKNALLRVTFAVELRKQGKSIMEATVLAGEMRLRPIIMTSLAFIFGVLPLALAMGAGANARHSIGTGIIGGMIGETTLAMLYVPLFFYLFDQLTERLEQKKKAKAAAGEGEDKKGPPDWRGPAKRIGRGTDMKRFIPILPVIAASCRLRRGAGLPAPRDDRLPASYMYEVKDAADTANTEWWHQFEDPVLDALIDEALANNKNVKIAAAKVEQAAGLLVQTRSPIFPQLNYSGSGERQRLTELGATPYRAQRSPTRRRPTRSLPGRAGRSISGAAFAG